MTKHILLAAGTAILTALTIGLTTSYAGPDLKRGARRTDAAGPRQHVIDSTASLPAATRTGQTTSDEVQATQSTSTAAPINLDWVSINHGGAINLAAGDLRMGVTIGQNAAGFVAAGPYEMGLGFWYGSAAAAPCACSCFGDPMCDGVPTILDIVRAADVAFRGGAGYIDPSPTCPFETTDVNCDGVTSILDVVRMADVAFRGGDAAVLYCDPCAP